MTLAEDGLYEDDVAWPTMIDLSACLCNQIHAAGLPEPCFCGVIPGPLAVLEMCGACRSAGTKCGGQAWVRFVTEYPSKVFPTPDQDGTSTCGGAMAYTLEVGIARCMPTGSMSGVRGYVAPTLEEQVEATRVQMADKQAMRKAIACCFKGKDVTYQLGGYTPIQNGGDCGGGIWTVTVWEV